MKARPRWSAQPTKAAFLGPDCLTKIQLPGYRSFPIDIVGVVGRIVRCPGRLLTDVWDNGWPHVKCDWDRAQRCSDPENDGD